MKTKAVYVNEKRTKISSSSCALPKANTGIKQQPPRETTLCTVVVNFVSLSSLGGSVVTPKVDSMIKTSGDPPRGTEPGIKCRSSSIE